MVRRSGTARFMPGAWVFPGGAVAPDDHVQENLALLDGLSPNSENGPWLAAAFREVVEETGIWLTRPPRVEPVGQADVYQLAHRHGRRFAADRIAYFANWVTPSMVPVRFDARFFIVAIADRVAPQPDGVEIDAAEYVAPAEALRRSGAGEWLVPFPTQRTLHELERYGTVEAALEEWRHRAVVRVQPKLRVSDDGALEVVMPGERGFDDLDDLDTDPETLAGAARVAGAKGSPVAEVAGGDD